MADEDYLKQETLETYLVNPSGKKHRNPTLKTVMIICNSLKLEYKLSIDLVNKAGYSLKDGNKEHEMYDYLLTITNAPLYVWDEYLKEEELDPLKPQKNN